MACWSNGMAGGYAGYQNIELIADKHLSKLERREGCASARLVVSRIREEVLFRLLRALVGRARCSGEGLLSLSQMKPRSSRTVRNSRVHGRNDGFRVAVTGHESLLVGPKRQS